ncbi:hypothetical protein [Sphingomonas sp.]|uniref:hypothetical protein n=1 Tax=Sphingomonas sp. TaxID=28214 RepID=UPI0035BBC671
MPGNDPQALLSAPQDEPEYDAHGFDPADFEWRPVPRRPRADGWTPDVQRAFIEALADTGLVSAACEAVDMSVASAYRLRRAAGSGGFRSAWDDATAHAAARLTDVAFTRAIEGTDIPVFDRDGCRIGAKRQYSDRLLMFLLRAYRPEVFRHANQEIRRAHEPAPAPPRPVVEAVAALAPVLPPAPHALLAPDDLAEAVEIARMWTIVEANDPPDRDRERYVRERIEPNHPAASARRAERHRREAERRWGDEEEY